MSARRNLLVAAAAVLAAPALGGAASAAEGVPPSAVGWWTRQPGATAADDGGFEVASLGSEPASVAALRFDAEGGAVTATLTLVESASTMTPAASLRVCTTDVPWEPANPGAYDDAPEPDCAEAVDLARDEETSEWTAEVAGLLDAGSLMVVPSEAPGGGSPLDPGFRIVFSGAALEVVRPPAAGASPAFAEPSGGGGGGSFAPPPSSEPSPSPDFGGGSPATGGPFDIPSTDAAGGDTTVTTIGVDEGEDGGGDGAGEEAFMAPELAAGASSARAQGKPWGRLIVLVPLAAALGIGSVHAKKLLAQRGIVGA